MIRVTHLSKTYKAKKKRNDTHAIKDMTFTLPNTGMIFIVGKSGSGKSTLLNILGGLDDFDGGSVIVDGNNLGEMSHDDFNRYRSSYVSFIFQDHFLVDDLSLIDNVGISLNVLNMDDYNLTSEALESVDLINKANSLPKELSGGERQRGAVARAIVKKPKLILCDEPTGNLDDYNTKLVFDLLKKLSKESLVVVVSHDLDSANIYADRILEIFDGTILSDEEKNANYSDNLIVTSENIKIPFNRTLSNSDIDLINKNIENKKLILSEKAFEKTTNKTYEDRKVELVSHKFCKKKIHKISKIFIFKRLTKLFVASIIISLIISCFAIFQSLISFDGNEEIANILKDNGYSEIMIRKNPFKENNIEEVRYDDYIFPVSKEDYKVIEESSYKGKIYPVYNYAISSTTSATIRNENFPYVSVNLKRFYLDSSYGTVACDYSYLEKTFGSVDVIMGDIYDNKGMILTDYVADSILYNSQEYASYDDIIGPYVPHRTYKWPIPYVSAIIKTDYKTRYNDLIKLIDNKDYKGYLNSDSYSSFVHDVVAKYGLTYSLSTNFVEDHKTYESQSYIPFRNAYLEMDGNEYYMGKTNSIGFTTEKLNYGEALIDLPVYNTIFGTNYTKEELETILGLPEKDLFIKIKKYYDFTKENSNDLYSSIEVKIVGVKEKGSNDFLYVPKEQYERYKDLSIINYGFVLDDLDGALTLTRELSDYLIEDANAVAVARIEKYVNIFKRLSLLVCFVIGVLGFVYLVFYEKNNVESNKLEIGILKACGMRQRNISVIFIIQQILLCIIVSILSIILSVLLLRFGNYLIASSIEKFAGVFISNLVIIRYRPISIFAILSIVIFVIMISCIIPVLLLTRVKPMNIIKAKE